MAFSQASRGHPAASSTTVVDRSARGGRFLTFFLGDEEYGLEILVVQEIIGMQTITRVPRTPAAFRGVINLRGKVIPILDLRQRFGMPTVESTLAGASEAEVVAAEAVRCIIVVQVADPRAPAGESARSILMGVVVDRVSEVALIPDADIEDAPSFGVGVRTEYLLGLGKTRTADGQGRVRLLLDVDRVLAATEVEALTHVGAAGDPA